MAVEVFTKQSQETKPSQFYEVSLLIELVCVGIVINVVTGGLSGEGLK